MFKSKREILFTILTGFFVANAVVGELIGGKLIQIGPFTMSIGIIPWPVVFLATDIINEYFGKSGVRRLTFMTTAIIIYVFIILFIGMNVNSAPFSPVKNEHFNAVFGQSLWIIVGSLAAFIASQLIDMGMFWLIRKHTGKKMIWLRATGSTAVSQLIDSFIVTGIAFWLPGKISFVNFVNMATTGYLAKLLIAVAITPLIYLGHGLIHKYLGKEASEEIITQTANAELEQIALKI